jgi:hypothetical protein
VTLSTSSFKAFFQAFKPLFLALLVIVLTERATTLLDIPQQYNTDLLTLAPQQKERITSIFITEKLNRLNDIPAQYFQVGDSSGFYGVKPLTVTKAMGNGATWLNFGCCGRAGFVGYRLISDEILHRQAKIGNRPTHMVLAMTPYYPPVQEFEDSELAQSLDITFAQKWRPHFYVAGWRLALTNLLYVGDWDQGFLDDRVDIYWYLPFSQVRPELERIHESNGWMIRPGAEIPFPTDACDFEIEYEKTGIFKVRDALGRTLFRRELDATAEFARSRNLQLVVVFDPVPCQEQGSEDARILQADLEAFRAKFPEVAIPLPLVRTYPATLFKDRWHLNGDGAERNSEEIGRALRDLEASKI